MWCNIWHDHCCQAVFEKHKLSKEADGLIGEGILLNVFLVKVRIEGLNTRLRER